MTMTTHFILASLAIVLLAGCSASERAETNKEIVRRMIEAINARDFRALDDVVATNIHRHSAATPGVTVENLEEFKQFLHQDLSAVPDAQQEVAFMLAEDDLVAVYAAYRGTQRGQFGPFPPSNKTLELPFIAILRLEGGKIAEMWVEWDNLNALTQLGHFPPAEDSAAASDGKP